MQPPNRPKVSKEITKTVKNVEIQKASKPSPGSAKFLFQYGPKYVYDTLWIDISNTPEMSKGSRSPARFEQTLELFDATGISMERIIWAGIFVVTGIARGLAGSALVVSMLMAAVISILAVLSFVPFAPFEVGVLSGACLELR
jgi:hypothetical protein